MRLWLCVGLLALIGLGGCEKTLRDPCTGEMMGEHLKHSDNEADRFRWVNAELLAANAPGYKAACLNGEQKQFLDSQAAARHEATVQNFIDQDEEKAQNDALRKRGITPVQVVPN
jgi:hypothetical protein